jgi:hypothetical protein
MNSARALCWETGAALTKLIGRSESPMVGLRIFRHAGAGCANGPPLALIDTGDNIKCSHARSP